MGISNGQLFALFLTLSLLRSYQMKITFPVENLDNHTNIVKNNESVKSDDPINERTFVRSLEVTDSSEIRDSFAFPSSNGRGSKFGKDDRDFNSAWERERKRYESNKGWSLSSPDEKTISFQVLDDEPYHHGRPAWPHDEYLVGYFDLNRDSLDRNVNGNSINESISSDSENFDSNLAPDEVRKNYEWRRLQQQLQYKPSAFIGPGFYDVSSSSSSYYDTSGMTPEYYRYQPTHLAVNTEGSTKIQTGSTTTESVPGTPSESITNTRQFAPYLPYDYFKRKRLRLQIHPGLIAAPLAGALAFGAASALTSKPLLVELGYVRNKPLIGGGWGWAGGPLGGGFRPYPPFYPPPNQPPPFLHPAVGTGSVAHTPVLGGGPLGPQGGVGPIYPVLKPPLRDDKVTSPSSSSWWNPFSALTPRLVLD